MVTSSALEETKNSSSSGFWACHKTNLGPHQILVFNFSFQDPLKQHSTDSPRRGREEAQDTVCAGPCTGVVKSGMRKAKGKEQQAVPCVITHIAEGAECNKGSKKGGGEVSGAKLRCFSMCFLISTVLVTSILLIGKSILVQISCHRTGVFKPWQK